MKKLILLIVICTTLNSVFAQTKQELVSFLSDRMLPFEKLAKMVYVNNLDSVIKVCRKKDISYSHHYFVFYGENLDPEKIIRGSGKAVIRSKKIPFYTYKAYKENGNLIIETVSGNDCL